MTPHGATIPSLALALIFSFALGATDGRKWKLEKSYFPSMSISGKYEVMICPKRTLTFSVIKDNPGCGTSPTPTVPGHSPGVGHPVVCTFSKSWSS
ncbi:hypothetical protein ACJRO7_004181 [Eucalyptus globulus]|uniref:Uncharacterized protein n=1 Tax=Eucalyptus globulus TaxID=34317 RepID=A0ABD3IYK8_EUCGL